jgi:hypothetical protein
VSRTRFCTFALVATLCVVAAATAAAAHGGADGTTVKLRATLKPSPPVLATGEGKDATGTFVATISKTKHTLTWRLTYAKLTGPATAAHLHYGSPAVDGGVLVPLCEPCRSGVHGTQPNLSSTTIKELQTKGRLYVNVHSRRWTYGEISGPLKVVK